MIVQLFVLNTNPSSFIDKIVTKIQYTTLIHGFILIIYLYLKSNSKDFMA